MIATLDDDTLRFYNQQQQPFYDPLTHDSPGESLPDTVRHINPASITILLSTSN